MKVSQSNSSPIQSSQASEAQAGKKAEKSNKTSSTQSTGRYESVAPTGSARAEISSKAKEFSKAKAVADAAPDVREDRVADLKKRINSGQYKIDADAIADRMFEEHSRLG